MITKYKGYEIDVRREVTGVAECFYVGVTRLADGYLWIEDIDYAVDGKTVHRKVADLKRQVDAIQYDYNTRYRCKFCEKIFTGAMVEMKDWKVQFLECTVPALACPQCGRVSKNKLIYEEYYKNTFWK